MNIFYTKRVHLKKIMGRHFSESEVSAMSRNKIEDKGLRQRLFRLHEDKTTTYDNYAKEKKRVLDLLKENRKTSGNIHVEFDETDDTEEIFKHVLLSRRPWSCTPTELTFNVIYREASDPGLLKATYRLKDKSNNKISSRKASAKSVPNDSRYLTTSRQSTRSEPLLQRPKSCFPHKTRISSNILKKFGNGDSKTNSFKDDISSGRKTEIQRPRIITAAWTETSNNKYGDDITNTPEAKNLSAENGCIRADELVSECNVHETKVTTDGEASFSRTEEDDEMIKGKSPTKSKVKKRLSIQEPTLNKSSENDVILTKIYEIGNVENGNDHLLIDTNLVTEITEYSNGDYKASEQDKEQHDTTLTYVEGDTEPTQTSEHQDVSPKASIERQISRPSTVAFGESLSVVDFNSLQNENLGDDYILFKGRPIHNYVKPQLRYKHDPFSAKSRERLIRKLTTDIPILPKEEKCRPVKYHRVYSKGARKRMLKELIEENNLQNNRLSYNADNGKLENKIQEFYNSISEFCGQNATG